MAIEDDDAIAMVDQTDPLVLLKLERERVKDLERQLADAQAERAGTAANTDMNCLFQAGIDSSG